jgi:hypothetical protein
VAPNAIPELLEQIDELLAEPAPKEEPASLAYLERTLTDGYAYALELESERWRLERRRSSRSCRTGCAATSGCSRACATH